MSAARLRPAAFLKLMGALCSLAPQVYAAQAGDIRQQLAMFSGTWSLVPAAAPTSTAVPAPGPAAAGPPPLVRAALPRFRPEVAAKITAALRPPAPGTGAGTETRNYCKPATFNGQSGYVVTPGAVVAIAFEILDSPGRLTLLDELGLVRRIHVRSTPPESAFDQSDAGTSIAQFDGRTLVVRTTGLNPAAQVFVGVRDSALGDGATVVERFTPVGADELEIVSTVTAPQLYAAPVTTTNRYRRQPGRELVVMSVCVEGDRSVDPATGVERFNATPPADLPPPPAG